MSKSYVNIPMTDAEKRAFEETDARWTGPRLVVLCAATLGGALFLLTALAWGWIGPDTHKDTLVVPSASAEASH